MEPLKERDPQTIGPYTTLGRLGSGAMGRVFLARAADGSMAAVKVVHENLASDASFHARFRREVQAARRVSGPRTAGVLDADPEAELPWMAVEYVQGPNLDQQIKTHGPMPATHIFWLAGGIALALGEIHDAGVTHRDLKPTNVLLSPTGPRVIDFGIARSADASAITTTGLVTGSPAFMSPEQATSGTVTPASDIFCLGSVLFFAATGHPVFGSGPPAAMLFRVVHNDADLTVITDPELRTLIQACLSKEPGTRPSLAGISRYATMPAGQRGPRLLGPVPIASSAGATQVISQALATQVLPATPPAQPPAYAQPPVQPPARPPVYGRQPEWSTPPGDQGRRRSSPWPAIGVALLVIALIAGGFYVVQQVQKGGEATATRTPAPAITQSGPAATTTARTATTTAPPTSAPPTSAPPASVSVTAPPASPADVTTTGPNYLYTLASGVFGGGTRRAYVQDGFQSHNSTSLTVSCAEGSPWANQFRVAPGAKRVTGTLLLDSRITPADLVVDVELLAGGKRIDHWELEPGDTRRVNKSLRGASTLVFSLVKVSGSCGLAPHAFAVLVDGQEIA